jgi:hypothetical protein
MNLNGRIWTSTLVMAAFLAQQSTASNAQSGIGKATRVKPDAQANTRTLAAGSDVHSNETYAPEIRALRTYGLMTTPTSA